MTTDFFAARQIRLSALSTLLKSSFRIFLNGVFFLPDRVELANSLCTNDNSGRTLFSDTKGKVYLYRYV